MAFITGDDRNQIKVIMTSLDEMIDLENPVRVIDAYIDSLDLFALGFKEYRGNTRGQSPYRRTDLLKIHIYGYLNKIRSSRKLEVEAKRNLELMWLINSIQPDHGTIAGFVTENKKAFRTVLRELTLILKGWGLIDGRIVAIDGTKIRAQNSKHNCITESNLNKKLEYAEEQINYYLSEIERTDTDTNGYKEKLETYQELKKNYQKQKSELKDAGLEQKSLTDKDSRRMKNNGNLEICYNVQTVVDSKKHFVIDAVVVNDINDQNQLSHMALNAKKLLRKRKMRVLADTGYYNGSEIKKCVDKKLTILIKKAKANNQTKDNQYRKERFVYDADKDIYICPASQELRFFENTSKNGLKYKKYKCFSCNNCPKKSQCTTSISGRTLQRWEHEYVLEEVQNNTLANNEIYKLRRCIVEHPYGTVKRTFGYSYFLRRELENVNAESASMFIAYNLKRLLSIYSAQELAEKFKNLAV
jgi:Transposase and inactivated derivatives